MVKVDDFISTVEEFLKGGVGSGIKGHTTATVRYGLAPGKDFRVGVKHPDTEDWAKRTAGMSPDEAFEEIDGKEEFKEAMRNWYFGDRGEAVHAIGGLKSKEELSTNFKYKSDNWRAAREYYVLTRRYLKAKYPDGYITAYRGIGVKDLSGKKTGDSYDIPLDGTSSWSTTVEGARIFSDRRDKGMVIEAKIPIRDVFTHPDLAYKHFDAGTMEPEKEIIVLTAPDATISGKIHHIHEKTSSTK